MKENENWIEIMTIDRKKNTEDKVISTKLALIDEDETVAMMSYTEKV